MDRVPDTIPLGDDTVEAIGEDASVIGVRRCLTVSRNHTLEIRLYETVSEGLKDSEIPFLKLELIDREDGTTYVDNYYFDEDGTFILHKYLNPRSETRKKRGRDLNTEKLERYRDFISGLAYSAFISRRLSQHPAIKTLQRGDYELWIQLGAPEVSDAYSKAS
jgi:hypothetical protein